MSLLENKHRPQPAVFLIYAFLFSVVAHLGLALLLNSPDPADNKASSKEITISLNAIASSSSSEPLLSSEKNSASKPSKQSEEQLQVTDKTPRQIKQTPQNKQNDLTDKIVSQAASVTAIPTSSSAKLLAQESSDPLANTQKEEKISEAEMAKTKVPSGQLTSLVDKKQTDSKKPTDIQQISKIAETEAGNETDQANQPSRFEIGSTDNPRPQYPSLARKRGWQGQVILGVTVRADGSIEHLTFVKSSDYGVLNYEAYETVRTSWQFKPLDTPSDKTSYIEVPITFGIANR